MSTDNFDALAAAEFPCLQSRQPGVYECRHDTPCANCKIRPAMVALLRREVEKARGEERACDACSGTGKALSGECGCGGTGLMQDMIVHLREVALIEQPRRIAELEAERDEAQRHVELNAAHARGAVEREKGLLRDVDALKGKREQFRAERDHLKFMAELADCGGRNEGCKRLASERHNTNCYFHALLDSGAATAAATGRVRRLEEAVKRIGVQFKRLLSQDGPLVDATVGHPYSDWITNDLNAVDDAIRAALSPDAQSGEPEKEKRDLELARRLRERAAKERG
jgi:hypothetical protein